MLAKCLTVHLTLRKPQFIISPDTNSMTVPYTNSMTVPYTNSMTVPLPVLWRENKAAGLGAL